MLGGWSDCRDLSGRLVNGRKDCWKPNLTVTIAVISFVKKTGKLNLGGYVVQKARRFNILVEKLDGRP
jgi:hypothetical protein